MGMQTGLHSGGGAGAWARWGGNPFDPDDDAPYRRWRDARLTDAPTRVDDVAVEVADPAAPTPAERAELAARLRRGNAAVYIGPPSPALPKDGLRALGAAFGLWSLDCNMLADDDGITPLAVAPGGARVKYIPYTDRPLTWHTDGYYNAPGQAVRSILLHCVRPAAQGGANALLDHEIAYILLRDADPAHIAALMRPDALYIPPNAEEGQEERPGRDGPVFSVQADGRLHMRYSRRKTNIVWNPAGDTLAAVAALEAVLDSDSPFILRHRMDAGQGLICANILHNRTKFSDPEGTAGRLIYRARFHDALVF